jgi:CO dehydrogenase nickel-insertion accessory protein CooC1
MTKQINLVINGKGGVGKSFFATNFVQYLKDRRTDHRAIDSNRENSTLKRFHPESDFINLEDRREIDRMFAAESSDLFRQAWDEVARVIASIQDRIVSASLILHRLGSYARAFFRCAEDVNSPLSDGVILRKKG